MLAAIILIIQYILFISFSSGGSEKVFGFVDLILHFVFFLQTIIVMFRIYFFIFGKNNENMKEKDVLLIRTLDNIIIITALILFGINAILALGLNDYL